ncbi:hypothetical protein BDR05DRAFT_1056439 [Suillus weaverae]|nr:hypothetical protein BDR05DRAFT_1056439 [Suillus weaverae]
MSRQGGKLKPLKAPKKESKEEDEDDKAFKERKKAEEAALKVARDKAVKGEHSKYLVSPSVTHEFNRWCSWWRNQEIGKEITTLQPILPWSTISLSLQCNTWSSLSTHSSCTEFHAPTTGK